MMKPLLMYAVTVLLSNLLFAPKEYIGKAVERSVFLLVYPLGERWHLGREKLSYFCNFLTLAGFLLFPVVLYKFLKTGTPAPLWGGVFEVAILYSLFSLSSLGLFLYRRSWFYFIAFVFFLGVVFFSARRSTLLGLLFTLLLLLFLMRDRVGKRVVVATVGILLVGSTVAFLFLVEKDPRFRALYEVITHQRSIDDRSLSVISSYRWDLAKAGIEVIRKDIEEKRVLNLLLGHGMDPAYRLNPPSPIGGGTYESVILISEFTEKGLLGLAAILWMFWSYYRYLIRFRFKQKEDFLLIPLVGMMSVHLIGSIFTGFWDAMLPLFLLYLRVVEVIKSAEEG